LKLLFENFGLCLPCFRGKGEGIWVIVYPWFEQERSGKGPGARIRGRECHRESEHREEAHQPPSTWRHSLSLGEFLCPSLGVFSCMEVIPWYIGLCPQSSKNEVTRVTEQLSCLKPFPLGQVIWPEQPTS
jgi:hypothetical protein